MERAYTVKELDALRAAIRNRQLWGSYRGPVMNGQQSYNIPSQSELTAVVESQVRTHMLAGHTAEDLIASEGAQTWAVTPT